MILVGLGLVTALSILPVADWIPGMPGTSLPSPYWPLYLFWFLGYLVLGLVAWALARLVLRKGDSIRRTEGERSGVFSGHWAPLLVVLVIPALVYTLTSWEVFSARPLYLDALTQAFQAQIFAQGRLSAPLADNPQFFSSLLIVESGRQVFSQFPPGWAGLLALGILVGVPWLVPPLCGALAAYGLFLLLRENGESGGTAVFTALVFALAPWFVFNAASWMNHVPTVSFILLGSWAVLRGIRDPSRWMVLGMGGALLGLAALIRPLEGVAFGVPATVWVVARGWKEPALRKGLAAFAAGGTVMLALLMAYNWVQHGSPGTFGFEVQWGASHGLGFHEAPWGPPHTFLKGFQFINVYLLALQQLFFDAPLPSLIPALVAIFLARRFDALDRYLLAGSGLVLLGYLAFWGEGHYLGPRYLLPLAPLVAIWTVRLGGLLVERTGRGWMKRGAYIVVVVLLAGGWLSGAKPRRFVYSRSYPLRRLDLGVLETPRAQQALVFLPSSWSSKVQARLRATGIPRRDARWFHDRIGFCRMEVALAQLEAWGISDPDRVAEELLPLTADSIAMVRDTLSGIPGDPFTGMGEGEEAALTLCQNRQTLELAAGGYLMLPVYAAMGPTWSGNGPIVARDLHEENRRLLAAYPDREAYVLRPVWMRGMIRGFDLLPLDADSVEAVWSTFERLRQEASVGGGGPESFSGVGPSVLHDVILEHSSVGCPLFRIEPPVGSHTMDGGPGREEGMMGVVVGKEPLATESKDARKPFEPLLDDFKVLFEALPVKGVGRRQAPHLHFQDWAPEGKPCPGKTLLHQITQVHLWDRPDQVFFRAGDLGAQNRPA